MTTDSTEVVGGAGSEPTQGALSVEGSLDAATLYSRNWAFIPHELQSRLERATIFLAGVGLASQIATLATRTGLSHFILADGDQVELSNLNRQAFSLAQVGHNKADATAAAIHAIRPDAVVDTSPTFLDGATLTGPLARADYIVNSIDFDNPALFALNRAARRSGKTTLMPLNLGWGGALIVFTPEAPTLEQFLDFGEDEPVRAAEVAKRMVERALTRSTAGTPPYLAATLADFLAQGERWPNEPQLGAATALTAALCVRAIVALVAGDPLRVAPAVNHVDLRVALEPPVDERARVTIHHRQVSARHPSLLSPALRDAVAFARARATGLQVRILRHGKLSREAREVLTAFRLDQYALYGLYRASSLADEGGDGAAKTDPSFDRLADDAFHVVALAADGVLLSYACAEGPAPRPTGQKRDWLRDSVHVARLRDRDRRLFPTEDELFGAQVFPSLAYLARQPLSSVREITRITSNKAVASPLTGLAVLEVIHAISHLVTDARFGIRFLLGCANDDGRRALYAARTPVLYAPQTEYERPQRVDGSMYWDEPGLTPGAFWPFIIAGGDVRASRVFYTRLDQALGAEAREAPGAVERLLAHTVAPAPRTLAPSAERSTVLWTADPYFPVKRRAPH